MVIPKPVEDRD